MLRPTRSQLSGNLCRRQCAISLRRKPQKLTVLRAYIYPEILQRMQRHLHRTRARIHATIDSSPTTKAMSRAKVDTWHLTPLRHRPDTQYRSEEHTTAIQSQM